ncbi:DoxX family protein [Shewanella sp. GXUN23E]|uniref:DoxX family protein n=1 Tax=Shewanella sp. GXUN23E TaxID=3422498 RepID=UPI003D7D1406
MKRPLLNTLLQADSSLAPLALRIPAGVIFTAHGAQKLFGMFGGYGLSATGQWMESIGLAPGLLMALLAGGAEFLGGLLILMGLLTRPAALVLAFTMLVAIVSVHLGNGLFMSNNGYEFGLVLLAVSLSLLLSGCGRFGLDRYWLTRLSGDSGLPALKA